MGMIVVTAISQYENEELLVEGPQILKQWNLTRSPFFAMTDKSSVELGGTVLIMHDSRGTAHICAQ